MTMLNSTVSSVILYVWVKQLFFIFFIYFFKGAAEYLSGSSLI